MKLLRYHYEYDFGHTIIAQLFKIGNTTVIDFRFAHSSFWSWMPNIKLNFSILDGKLVGIYISLFNVSVELGLLNFPSYL